MKARRSIDLRMNDDLWDRVRGLGREIEILFTVQQFLRYFCHYLLVNCQIFYDLLFVKISHRR